VKFILFSYAVIVLNTWRLLESGEHDAFTNMAVDEAVLESRIHGEAVNTLRLYGWTRSAVSIGKFQRIANEVQLENCLNDGIDVVRRITGGGSVFHDSQGEITYSVVSNMDGLKAHSIAEVYARICSGLVEALSGLGVRADFNEGSTKACPNLTVNGKKISGSAQCHRRGMVLQHGTILARVNFEKMFTYLRVPWAQTCMQVAGVAKRKITYLDNELGRKISTEELAQALIDGFKRALNIELIEGKLTVNESEFVERLRNQKYVTKAWNFEGKSMLN